MRLNGTKETVLSYVEEWLTDAISPRAGASPMAYFLWDDEGVLALVKDFEKDFANDFVEVFSPVEKVDIFRIIVCKWFGGIVSINRLPLSVLRSNRIITNLRSTEILTPNLFNIPQTGYTNLMYQSGLIWLTGGATA